MRQLLGETSIRSKITIMRIIGYFFMKNSQDTFLFKLLCQIILVELISQLKNNLINYVNNAT